MTTFVFKAVDAAGVPSRGEVDAESSHAVADQLRRRGLIVLDIGPKKGSMEIDLDRFRRVKARDLTVASRQLATMVSSGMTLLRSLYVIEEQTKSKLLREALTAVRKDVEAGMSLSRALERHPRVFSPLYVAMVEAGEQGGILDVTLQRIADQLEKADSLRRQVVTAMVYPGVVITFAFVILIALVAFIVPVFAKMYDDLDGGDLPMLTQITMGMSTVVTKYGYVLVIAAVAVVFGFRAWKKSEWGRPQWDTFKMRVPFRIGDTVKKVALARWSRTYSALISAGVPMLQAIEVTSRTSGNVIIERAMEDVGRSVRGGGTISAPLKASPAFPPIIGHMVAVGEETGALDTMLTKMADFYEDEVAGAIKALTSILEPLMIIVVGGIVGFIVISMYLPMFGIYEKIG